MLKTPGFHNVDNIYVSPGSEYLGDNEGNHGYDPEPIVIVLFILGTNIPVWYFHRINFLLGFSIGEKILSYFSTTSTSHSTT